MSTTLIIVYSVVIVILLACSFFFSMSDMAYSSTSSTRLEKISEEKPSSKSDARAYKLSKNYDKTISTILFFNDLVNAGIDTVSTMLGIQISVVVLGVENETFGLIASLIALFLKMLFGEMIAKTVGKMNNYKAARSFSTVITICYYITLPVTFLVGGFGVLVTYPFIHKSEDNEVKDDELHEMIEEFEEEGVIDKEKADIIRGTIDYATTEAYEIMTPRAKLVAYEKTKPLVEILNNSKTFNFSRILIYDDEIDNVIGYVRTKDLIRASLSEKEEVPSEFIFPVEFVPRTLEINELLQTLNEKHTPMAIVLDEYGGIEGLVTKEDILEEIVGEIWDETDSTDNIVSEKDDDTYIIDGGMNLEDFCQLFDLDFDEIDTEYVTIGGFIIELLDDKFAEKGDVIHYENLTMEVIAMGKHHTIKKLLVKRIKEEDED